jgi:hypothetical protein
MFYLSALKFKRVDLFTKFIRPFRGLLTNWLNDKTIDRFSDDVRNNLKKFLALTMNSKNSAGKNSISNIIDIYIPKFVRLFYNISQFIAMPELKLMLDKIIISISGWFDEDYFKETNNDLSYSKSSGLDHFVRSIFFENRNPNKWINIESFFNSFPEYKQKGVNPLVYLFIYNVFPKIF